MVSRDSLADGNNLAEFHYIMVNKHPLQALTKPARRGFMRSPYADQPGGLPPSPPACAIAAGNATLIESTIEVGMRMVAPRSLVVS
jgi:hypothetical protein